jgi:hypothetical protein
VDLTSARERVERHDDLQSLRHAIGGALADLQPGARWEIELLGHRMRIDRAGIDRKAADQRDARLVLSASLRLPHEFDPALAARACQLALANPRHFAAIAAVDSHDKSICFIECLNEVDPSRAVRSVEQVVNQIETWRRLLGPRRPPGSTR